MTESIPTLPVPNARQQALDFGRFRRGAGAREGAHHVGGSSAGIEQIAQQAGDGGLAVGARHADHQQVAGGEAVEGGGQAGHHGANGAGSHAGLDDRLTKEFRNDVLADQTDGAPIDRLGGKGVAIAGQSGNAAEQIARHHSSAVMGDPGDVDRARVPGALEDLYVVEQEVHLDGVHGRGAGGEYTVNPCHFPPAGRWYRVT